MAATEALIEFSDGLAAAVEKAGASTVAVYARRRIPASGVAWSPGVVVTADHVVEQDEGIEVGLPDGKRVAASLAGRDPGSDLAVLRLDGSGLAGMEPAPAPSARPGSIALAVARPGEGLMASLGVVSVVGGPWRTFRGQQVDGYLRSDTTFYPGFSGGPLVDAGGRVIGLNSSRLGRGSGLTIPAAAVSKVVEALLKGGRVRRGYLGVSSQQVRLPAGVAAKLGRAQEHGLLLVMVEPGSPAERGGAMIGDILTGIGGAKVEAHEDLQARLGGEAVGSTVTLNLLRGGEPKDVAVTVGERN
jgi:S1-C subfamily serine protease